MPSATDRRVYEDQIPPFMTVFDLDAETMADRETVTLINPKFVDIQSKVPCLMGATQAHTLRSAMIPTDPTHKHHDSTSTQTSESADSSPTTTLSTTDSSPLSDPSPSSSPDSPVNLIPLNNFSATSFGGLSNELPPVLSSNLLSVTEAPRLQRPMTSPSPRRARNMKGLSIQPPFAASATTASLVSEPASPSFIKPTIPAMKRKPSQLSLKTNTSDFIAKTTIEVPPSPAMAPMLQRRALKHSISSPHMLSGLQSSTFGPAGGMTFPKVLKRNESGLSEVLRPSKPMVMSFDSVIAEEESPIKTQMANRNEFEPYVENENNEDLKTPGYPDGPIAIYGDNVFLYLEPTAEEAARFDVVINVAREVKNPFEARKAAQEIMPGFSQFRQPTPEEESPIPDTAVSTASFATAFEYPTEDFSVETPTTPKAASFKTPEYIHIPWDHNTDIAPDLMQLCETIENRTKQGKKVLIHCQQGASRSASLIIAYGLYQKPELTVNDAYYAAQAKSRWISPNMKLMYSLQDFHKHMSTKQPSSRSSAGRNTTKHRLTLSADGFNIASKEPKTAPLPEKDDGSGEKSSRLSPGRLRGNSTPGPQPVSPGPASAPPSCTWAQEVEQQTEQHLAPFKLAELPVRPKSGHGKPVPTLCAPPAASASRLSLAPTPAQDPWSKPPPSPGFSSPASFGFQTLSQPTFSSPSSFGFQTLSRPRLSEMSLGNSLSFSTEPVERTISIPGGFPDDDDPLMSPRVETMTKNPLHSFSEAPTMRFVECPPTPGESLFSPRMGMFPRDPFGTFTAPPVADPRSPPMKGEAPIVRSIDDLL